MSRITYNKLVRDRIPDIIRASGRQCATTILPQDQYIAALLAKLLEESQELANAPAEERAMEIADIREVVDALMAVYGITDSEVSSIQSQRRASRGAFHHRLALLWAEPAHPEPDFLP